MVTVKTLSMLIRNETIRVELIVFIAIFADLATIAIAYDNAPYQARPVEWQLPKIWFISVILGLSCISFEICLLCSYYEKAYFWLPELGPSAVHFSYPRVV